MVTSEFEVKTENGSLEIGKAAVTLKSATLSKKYDGNALVNGDTALEVESGFAEGEGATYNFTGSQTVVGSSANAFSYELNSNTNIDNYAISKQEGTLTVTNREAKYEITVKANSATATYDGKEHEAVGVETYEFTVEGNSYTVSGLSTEDPKQKDAGSYTNNITGTPVVTDKEGNVVTSEFEVKTENGSLTITPRQVNLTSESASKPYDGTPLTRPSVTGGDGFVAGEVTDIRATGSVTNVSEGEVTNAITYATGEKFNADNYNITREEGRLSITASQEKVTVTITGHTNTEKYDGTPKKAEGYEVAIASDSGLYKEADFSFSGTAEVEKTDAAETAYPMGLAAGQFTNTNTNFANVEFVVTDGALTITPRQVILTSATDEKVYDGTPLTNHNVTVSGDGFAAGEGATYDVTGTQTDKGSSDNTFTYKLNEDTKASNYNIEIAVGKLTVKESEKTVVVTIKGNTDGKTYDGTEHSVSGYQVESIKIGENDTNLYTENDFEFSGKAEAKGTNAGTYPMGLKEAQFTNKNGNFTSVVFVVTDGKLEISPRQVTLTSESANKPYDGTALTRPDVAGGDGFVAGEVTDIRATGSVTNVSEGEVTNAITYATGEKFNADNYNITREEGRLSITASQEKVTVTITGHTNTEKYDGTPKKAEGYEVAIASDSGLYKEADFSFSGTAEVEKTDAAETAYPMGLAAGQFTNTNTNFANVEFVVTDGALTITPRQVILTSATDEKVYDGTPLTNHNVTVSGDGFAAGEGATYDVTGTQTDKGSSDNTFTYKLNENTKASNYSIELAPGELTVTPVTDKVIVTITEHSASLKYNGAEQSVTGYDTAIDNTLYKETDFTFSGDATAKGTDFGSYPMNLKAEDFTNKNKNFANVVFEIVDGQLEITKRDVELISGSDEKVYDGTPLTKNHILIAGDQFVPGEGADYDVTGSQTNAGSSDNEFTYRLNSSTKAINYNIKTTPGTLKVTPVTDNVIVTITEHSGSAKYDGTEKTVTGYDVAIDNELYTENDFTFSGNDVIKATDADIYNMELKPSDFNNISHNFASVTFKIVDGTLNISRRDVTLTSATDSKTYDGKPLTNDNVAVGGDGFAEGEGAVYNVTGSQTEAGFSNNTFSYELKDNTKTDNYNITSFEGILTVSSSEDEVVVTITGNKGTQKYDGTEKTVEGYTVSITSPLYKESDFTFDGIALAKGTNADTYMMGLSEENFTNTNKNFARVTFHVIDGSLVIEKRNLVLTSASAQKVYNGTELTAKDVTVSGDGFVKGEGASYDVTGTQTTVGDSENTFTYKLNENTNADNYTIETKNGSLLVTPVTDQVVVTLKENSGTEVYDGTEKTVTGYTVADISNKLYTDKDFTFTGNAEVKGTDAGTYDMELKAEDFQNINPNFTNVVFKVEDGALEITRRQVTFQADSGEKKYDGEELTVPTWKLADGTLADGQQEIAHVEGSQTLVGESENKITDLKIFANAASQEAEGSETEAQDVTKNYSIILLAGLLKVTDGSEEDPVDPGQVVTKTHEDKTYDLDETVTFTINVKNIYDEAKTVRIIELPGVVIEGAPQETPNVLTVEKVPAGETVTATATYKITEADIANGSFVNTVKVEFEGGKPFENTDTVITVDPVRSYTLTKKSSASIHENGMFKAGETIHYTLTVTNTGNQTLENVEITDTLNAAGTISNIQGADSKQDGKVTIFTISSLAPKAEATITYDYMVQEADKGNTISNAAVGTPANPEDPDGEKPGDNTDNPVENPKLEVKKDIVSITAADGTQKDKAGKADLNDIITYSVTVTNTGNMKLTNVKITDSLEGIQLAEGQSFDLGILEAGKAKTVTYTYQVKESDLGKSILNTATATGKVPEDPEDAPKPEGKDEKEVPTEDSVRKYTIIKTASASTHENGMFKAGETIHYTLTVTNTGNQTLENVEITDTLNAAGTISNIQGADSKQDGKVTIFTISSLAPKAEATITYDYMVQEADKGNTISNAAVGTPANPEDPDGEKPGDNTDNPVENPKLEVKKDIVSITAADGTQKDKAGKADLNDIITYSVTVTNTGNMKLTNVKITDSLEGIQLAEGQSFDLGILEAGKAKTVTYTYQVKESDLGKSILNTATATGDVPENPADTPKPEGKDEKEVPTEDPANCSITVTKRLTNIQGELLAVRAADFYVTLFSDEAMTQKAADTKMIHFDENQGTSSVTFDQLKRGTYYVAETDAEGKVVAEGTYNNGSYVAQYQAGNKVEITENGTAAQFQFDNQFLLLPDEYYIVKTITINKTVVKKNGEDLKSEETFYAGIFKDEDCTQLADGVSQNIVPLVMDGESTATAKTEVTVPVGGEEIKLYVTEVTADGTPVALNDTFEYDVEINDGFVTLSETSEDATVLIINTSRKEEPEPTAEPAQEPTEAPAEPTQAPQITQQPEDRAVTTNGVKTGDDSPLTQLAFMLFAASAAILLIIFLKKKDEKDIMK